MKSSNPVTVVIPTHNRLNCLAELLEALTRQTFKQFEVVVVNDGGEPVERILELYPELEVRLFDLCKVGHVSARNLGVERATTEYILLCDDDDLLLPCHIERMLGEIGNYDLVYSDVEIFDYLIDENQARKPTARFLFAYEYDLTAMRRFSTFVPSGCLYRCELHQRIGNFDAEVDNYWDWDFFLRAAAMGRVKRVPVASVLYAFSPSGDHMSAPHQVHRSSLDKLAAKHGLGELPTANFFKLLEEPEVRIRRAATTVLWDGKPFAARYLKQ